MANFLYSAVCADFDRRENSQPTCLSDSVSMGNEFEEVVPDSDDEDTGRREELRKGIIMGGELIRQQSGSPFDNSSTGEGEECGIVADSEEESDEGKCLVPNKHGGFSKRRLECLNGSRQPGESSQADALKFVDHFLKCNILDMSSEGKTRSSVKPRSPPNSFVMGLTTMARKIGDRTPAMGYSSYDWTDKQPNKKSMLCSKSDVLFYRRRRKRCATNMPLIATVKSVGDNLSSVSKYKQQNEELINLSNEVNDEAQTGYTLISGSDKVVIPSNMPETITVNTDKCSSIVTHGKLQNSRVDEEGGTETFDDVFNTQMAAEVMETLLFEPPKKWNSHIHSNSCQTIITDYPKKSKEREAKVAYSSMPNRSCSGLEVKCDIIKHTEKINGESGLQQWVIHMNDRPVDPHFSSKREDKVCNATHNSEELSWKTALERVGSREGGENSDNVHVEPHLLSQDYNTCRSLPKSCLETKISSSASPVRLLSKDQQLLDKKVRDITKDFVYTYKRKRSAMVRKENKNPFVMFDMGGTISKNGSRKEHKALSTVIPGCIALNSLVFPKGKRMSRRSSNSRNSDSISNFRSEADTEKEARFPLTDRYKPANHCTEPVWTKFPRKKRTSAAFNKQENITSCKAEASRKSNSYFTELRSSVGGAGMNGIFDSSSIFNGSDYLTSVSNNSGMMPLVSSVNSGHVKRLPSKIPKASLIKELVQLGGFSDIPLYSSCKNLRRRKHVANVRVLLSQHLDNDTIIQQKKVLARLGISIATNASDATHFVTNKFSRTKNMLEAIALGIPIVTQLWLENCGEAGCLVDEKSYILKDSRKEKEIGFSLSSSLAKASRSPLLKDYKVFITPNIKPDKGMLSGLVKMVHGEVLDLTKNNSIPEDVIVLSCEEDYATCMPFLAKGIPVNHPELLLNGIVTQKLDVQRHQLFQDRVKWHPPRTHKY